MSEHDHNNHDALAHLIPEVVKVPLIFPQQAAEFIIVLKSIFGLVTRPMIEIF
jgi:hypothetical protein